MTDLSLVLSIKRRGRPVYPAHPSVQTSEVPVILVGFAEEREQPQDRHNADKAKPRHLHRRQQPEQQQHHHLHDPQDDLEPQFSPLTTRPSHKSIYTATTSTTTALSRQKHHYSIPPMVSSSRPVRVLVASIGNPGAYLTTRHSAGHILNKSLASNLNFPSFQKNKVYSGSISLGEDVGRPELTLWQSNNMMNESGIGLLKAWKAFIRPSSGPTAFDSINGLVILHDELETAPGQLKIRRGPEASARGHNGIKSVINSLRGASVLPELGDRFIRVGIGIGRPTSRDRGDVSNYVLGQVTREERDDIQDRVGEVENLLQNEIMRISSSSGGG